MKISNFWPVLAVLSVSALPASAATFVVNSSGDEPDMAAGNGTCETSLSTCTLRAAIQEANQLAGADVIEFNIGGVAGPPAVAKPSIHSAALPGKAHGAGQGETRGGFWQVLDWFWPQPAVETAATAPQASRRKAQALQTIAPASALPDITESVTINAYTQPGSSANTLAVGSNAVRLITLSGARLAFQGGTDGSSVRGLTIDNFNGGGIIFFSTSNATIAGCDIVGGGSGLSGITIFSGDNNVIGGLTPADRNVLDNIDIRGNGTLVQNNYIGTNAQGTAPGSSFQTGVSISGGSNNVIGGPQAGAGNLISGNGTSNGGGGRDGIDIFVTGSTAANDNLIQNNIIGLDAAGMQRLGNIGDGISLIAFGTIGAANTRILGNVISGNGSNFDNNGNGIHIFGRGVTGTLVVGNTIGLNRARTNFVPNGRNGIFVDGEADDPPSTGNVFTQNFIAGNGALGIDLGGPGFGEGNGVTPNDANDADTGPNNEQNFPVLSSVSGTSSSTTIQGTLTSIKDTNFRIEFFANIAADASGNGEGQTFLGFQDVKTDGTTGQATINVTLPVALPPSQRFVTATATRLDGANLVETSEFSQARQAGGSDSCSFGVTNTNDAGPGSLRDAIDCANASNFSQTITFNIPGQTLHTINLTSALPAVTVPINVNGFSQPGSTPFIVMTPAFDPTDPFPQPVVTNPKLLIELNGANAGANADGLVLGAGSQDSIVRGLVINGFSGDGLVLRSDNNKVAACYIGTSADGTQSRGNRNGIFVDGGSNNTFGAEESTGSFPDATTTKRFFNLISANTAANVRIAETSGGAGGAGNVLADNFIGTDVSISGSNVVVTKALGGGTGVQIAASGNQVNRGDNNSIAGHSGPGVEIVRGNGNSIQIPIGIGVNDSITGDLPLGNGSHGVLVGSGGAANNNTINGKFANNGGDGVRVLNGTGNVIGGTFSSNAGLGINLVGGTENSFGVTANDTQDPDSGPNGLQNFPQLSSARPSGGDPLDPNPGTITGTLDSKPNTTFRLAFYSSDATDPSGNGEGASEVIIGTDPFDPVSTDVTTDSQGVANFSFPAFQLASRKFVTATATRLNGITAVETSEFSGAVQAINSPVTFVVNSTLDTADADLNDGACDVNKATAGSQCTLRAAIQETNARVGSDDIITFDIPGAGVKTIAPATPLPIITDAALIDGYTQSDAKPNTLAVGNDAVLRIELNGANITFNFAYGLSGNMKVRGLIINGFNALAGAGVQPDENATIAGCFIGTDASGTTARPNESGILIRGDGNTIGGPAPADRNLLSGNGSGISSFGNGVSNIRILNNYIGTNAAGTAALGNTGLGVSLAGASNVIGGAQATARNVISGNAGGGVSLGLGSDNGGFGSNNMVQGNFIGLNAAGTAAIANGASAAPAFGVKLKTEDNRVEDNVISGNTGDGVLLLGVAAGTSSPASIARNNIVINNAIGLNAARNALVPNTGDGIVVGIATGVTPGTGNRLSQNAIAGNGGLGIDLVAAGDPASGVTPNDAKDIDNNAANNLQNFPEITGVIGNVVSGKLSSYPNEEFRIEVFASNAPDPSGFGEGQTFLGATDIQTNAQGDGDWTLTSPVSLTGKSITATAIYGSDVGVGVGGLAQDGDTSEFSQAFLVDDGSCSTVVVNISDSGAGSLRAAIDCSNTTPGKDTISFAIGGTGVHTITPATALPPISDAAIVDGYTQPGASANTNATGAFNGTLRIELDGETARGNGLLVTGTGVTVRGLVVNGFGEGIRVEGDNNAVEGCYLGTDATGLMARPNLLDSVQVIGGSNNRVGGTTAATRNVSAGNTNASGIEISTLRGEGASSNVVQGNFIGLSANGSALPNASGIVVSASNNQIGGNAAGMGNVISAHSIAGIIVANGAQFNTIQGNRVGTDAAGAAAIPNALGIEVRDSPRNSIIGNVISGNGGDGVFINGTAAGDNQVSGNLIGRNAANTGALGNTGRGVALQGSGPGTIIGGGVIAGNANTIAHNGGAGVAIIFANGACIEKGVRQNSIFANGGLGIDLEDDGVTQNDAGDGDTGANEHQNFPVITSANTAGGTTTIKGTLNSRPNLQYRIEFFANDAADPSGFGEGQRFIGSKDVTTGADGNTPEFTFNPTTAVPGGQFISATATDPNNNTSEFSRSLAVTSPSRTLSIGDATVIEGTGGSKTATLVVTLSAASPTPVTVNFASQNGSATAPGDFTARSGTLTFAPGGPLTQNLVFSIVPDAIDEEDEDFSVTLSNPSGASLDNATGFVTLTDDDTALLSVADVSVSEGNTGLKTATLTATLSTPAQSGQTFEFSTSDGTAQAGSDYQAKRSAIFFAPGDTSEPVTINIIGDTAIEPNETFSVTFSGPVGTIIGPQSQPQSQKWGALQPRSFADIGDGKAIVTIVNDDTPGLPAVSVADTSVTEGTGGTREAVFTVSLSAAPTAPVLVDFATAPASALSPADFMATTGTLTFASGQQSQSVRVAIVTDNLDENNETFGLNLSNLRGASPGDLSGIATITDDDTAAISLGDARRGEGNAGTAPLVFTASLSNPCDRPVLVDFATQNGSANAPGDFVAQTGTLTFPANVTSQTLSIAIVGDTLDEPDETFAVVLSNPRVGGIAGVIADGTGQGTILDDDTSGPPTLSINDVRLTEGSSGTATAVFTVRLSAASPTPVKVDFATVNGSAIAPADFAARTGSLTFTPGGSLTQTIAVSVVADTIDENDEIFAVNLSAPTGATLADGSGICSITDDDSASLSIADGRHNEGNTGLTPVVLTARLSTASDKAETFRYATRQGSAIAGTDFQTATGQLVFAPGETAKTITLNIIGDTALEPDETFFVDVTLPAANAQRTRKRRTRALLGDASALVTILNDDAAFSVADASVREGNAGTTPLLFTVTRSGFLNRAATVNFATQNGTATAPGDFTARTGTLNFAANVATQTVTVLVVGDLAIEPNETLTLLLSSPNGGVLARPTAVGTILSDDGTDLALSQTGTQNSDGTLTFALALINRGPLRATNVVLTDTLPANATFVSSAPMTTPQNGVLSFALGTLEVGATRSFRVVVRPNVSATFLNRAVVAGLETDLRPADNTSTAQVVVSGPNVVTGQIGITAGPVVSVGPYIPGLYGKSRIYAQTITVKNNGAALNGPVSLVFDNLASNVHVTGASGVTAATSPAGRSFLNLPIGADSVFGVGEVVSVTLRFDLDNPAPPSAVSFTPRLLAGPGNR